jgi:predicted ArsR family transcriptional regulator
MFISGQFADLRRVREKLESLVAAGLVVFHEYALGGRRTMNFYQLSRDGYRFLHGSDPPEG